jgi:hypothetical protein
MLAMTRPAPFTSSRLLARLRLEARPTEPSRRFEHLKRVFD